MQSFENLQTAMFEIYQTLVNNIEIRKLLFHDVENALELSAPKFSAIKEHIILSPIFDSTKPPYNKNTMITLALTRSVYDSDDVILNSIIKINVLTKSDLWVLKSNKLRLFEIIKNINNLIHDKKFATSHKLSFKQMELSILDEDLSGYSLSFLLEEGSGMVESF